MAEKIERKIHRLSDTLGITSDGDRNIMLMEYYEKQEGTGKNAPKTGEFAWRPFNGGAYYSTIESLGYGLLKKDVVEAIGEVGLNIDPFKEYIDGKLEEYKSFLKEYITLELAKTKDTSKTDESKWHYEIRRTVFEGIKYRSNDWSITE